MQMAFPFILPVVVLRTDFCRIVLTTYALGGGYHGSIPQRTVDFSSYCTETACSIAVQWPAASTRLLEPCRVSGCRGHNSCPQTTTVCRRPLHFCSRRQNYFKSLQTIDIKLRKERDVLMVPTVCSSIDDKEAKQVSDVR